MEKGHNPGATPENEIQLTGRLMWACYGKTMGATSGFGEPDLLQIAIHELPASAA